MIIGILSQNGNIILQFPTRLNCAKILTDIYDFFNISCSYLVIYELYSREPVKYINSMLAVKRK
jgi:hypothetical protein